MRLEVLFILLISISFVSASCVDSDNGNFPSIFGYAIVNNVIYRDTCISTTQLKEYNCNGNSYSSTNSNCLSCSDGICYTSTCSSANQCNPVLQKWCDGSSWISSSYCTDSNVNCFLVDSGCGASICTEGACDYKNHKYCKSNQWLSDDYCDNTLCGTNDNSRGYCYCSSTLITEVYCSDDIDDDCDGSIDCHDSDCVGKVGCECTDGETESCGGSVGECSLGVKTCVAGTWGACSGVEASSERCDFKDNDCDGEIDEECICVAGDTRDCGENVGVCKAGVQVCQDDATWSICYGASYSASKIESCNGLDDDCDGQVDEGCECVVNNTQICGSIIGACKQGLQTCVNGSWSSCVGGVQPFPEICGDKLDNDCDSFIDADDDTCSSEEVVIPVVEPVKESECISSLDCGSGYACESGECVVSVERVVENKTTTTTALSSSGLSAIKEESSFDFGSLLIPIIIIILVIVGIGLFVFSKKKKNIVESPISATSVMKSSFTPNYKSTNKKSLVDKQLDESFKESQDLFKK